MKTAVKLLAFVLTVLASAFSSCSKDGDIGPIGPQGEQGPPGEQGLPGEDGEEGQAGNANVLSYDFTVAKADWPDPKNHGGNNVYSQYPIPSDRVGGINFLEFYDAGGVILAYAKLSNPYATGYTSDSRNTKPLPLVTNVSKSYSERFGVRIDLSTRFGTFLLAKTTNGYDALNIPLEERPDAVDFRIIFIEASNSTSGKSWLENILGELKSAGVDVADYGAVMAYFGFAP